jgi:8-oxo-dGTP pyrophosphatase MutT (NUDIX family)
VIRDELTFCASCDLYPKAVNLLVSHLVDGSLYLGVSRKDDPSKYGLPGGKVESGETLLQALSREVLEETGLRVEEPVPVFAAVCRGQVDYLSITYKATVHGYVHTDEPVQVAWVSRQTLLEGPFGVYHRAMFARLSYP